MSDRKVRYQIGTRFKEGMSLDERHTFNVNARQIEESIKDRDTERMVVMDDDGEEIVHWDGTAEGVNITLTRAMAMKGRSVTHNHPNDSMLSYGDVYNLVQQDLQEMRAITTRGLTFSLRRVGTTDKTKQFAEDYHNLGYGFASRVTYGEWENNRGTDKYKLPNGLIDVERFMNARFNIHLQRWMMGHAKEYGYEFTVIRG